LHAENVVVRREEVHGLGRRRRVLDLDGHLRVVEPAEIARTGRLVLFRSQSERVRVHTRHRGARVVRVRLHLVEVLTTLRLHAVLAVEDELELFQRTNRTRRRDGTIFADGRFGVVGTDREERGTGTIGDRDEDVGQATGSSQSRVGFEDDTFLRQVRREVPQGRVRDGAVVEREHQLLHRVVEGQANLLGVTRFNRVGASVLHLLDEVFVGLLRESAAFVGVQKVVVSPALESGAIGVLGELGAQVHVDTAFVVLQGNQREGETRVAVEPEQKREIDRAVLGVGSHLGVVGLLGFRVVEVVVQTPPLLEVAVDALTTDGDFNVLHGTLRSEDGRRTLRGGAEARLRLHFEVHVLDQITVAGDRDRDTAVVGRGAVDRLLDDFRGEVRVTLVDGLEEGDLRVRSQVNILAAVRDELHETTGHCESCLYYTLRKKNWPDDAVKGAPSFLTLPIMTDKDREEGEIIPIPVEEEEEDDFTTDDEEEEEDDVTLGDDDDDMEMDIEFDDGLGATEQILTSVLATPEGDTVCTALVHIGSQLEIQNKILIKILSKLT